MIFEWWGAWNSSCADQPSKKWQKIFNDWFVRMEKCIKSNDDYFERM